MTDGRQLSLLLSQLAQDSYNLKLWISYINILETENASFREVARAFEAALFHLPGSYKIWRRYLQLRIKRCRGMHPRHERYEKAYRCFQRALVYQNKMPRIWMDFIEFSLQVNDLRKTREIIEDSLKRLSLTQHERILRHSIQLLRSKPGFQSLVSVIFEKLVVLLPHEIESYIDFLVEFDDFKLAMTKLLTILLDKSFESVKKKRKHDYWLLFCNLARSNAEKLDLEDGLMNINKILRRGILKYSDQGGFLWCTLAECYVKKGHFGRVGSIYEEGMKSVKTVHDFSIIFEAYAQFQESLVSAKIEVSKDSGDDNGEIDVLLTRLNSLLDRRPFLLNDVLLRQNPNNILEWKKRIALSKEANKEVSEVYSKALDSIVISEEFVGNPAELYIGYAELKEEEKDFGRVEKLYKEFIGQHAVIVKKDYVVDAIISYSEYLLRMGEVKRTKELLKSIFYSRNQIEVNYGGSIRKNVKLWNLYADIEMSTGTVDTVRAVFEQVCNHKILTPAFVIQYAQYVEEHELFEDVFAIYERGVNNFDWPESREIWVLYLTKFCNRYQGEKLDRGRELFNQALKNCPSKSAYTLLLMYINFEDEFGFIPNQMEIFSQYLPKVGLQLAYKLLKIKIARSIKYFGLLGSRSVIEDCIQQLYALVVDTEAYKLVLRLCYDYARMETTIGEIERGRAVYQFGTQFCNPGKDTFYWDAWYDFELTHGNTLTFKEMLRVKRAAVKQFGDNKTLSGFVKSKYIKEETGPDKIENAGEALREQDSNEIDIEME